MGRPRLGAGHPAELWLAAASLAQFSRSGARRAEWGLPRPTERLRSHGGAEAGGFGSGVGGRVATGVSDAGDQHEGGLASGGEFALGGGLLEELVGFVAAGLGIGQDGG